MSTQPWQTVSRRRETTPTTAAAGTDERRRTIRLLALACAATVLVRSSYVWLPLRSDEAGYLLAARHWAPGAGEFVYGDYHVDRPPLLMAVFRLAAVWESDAAIRVMTIPVAVAGVLALARAGHLVAGTRGARCAALVAAALLSSPALAGDQANGGFFAAVLVAGAVAAALEAWRAPEVSVAVLLAALAGALGAAAPLVKQNFLDGVVFVGVLLLAHTLRDRGAGKRSALLGLAATVGGLSVMALTAVWTVSAGIEPGRMWVELVEFRGHALGVIAQGSLAAPATRAATVVLLAVISGVLPIAWAWVRWQWGAAVPLDPTHWAVSALLLYAVFSIVGAGSYWPHYLLQLVTPLAIAAGVVAATPGRAGRGMHRLTHATAGSALLCVVIMLGVYATVPHVWYPERLGQWLSASARPSDTAFVAYGSPSLLESADLTSPYPYLWSLSMRTYDPELQRLRDQLGSPAAPTWLVRINSFDSWGIDRDGRLRRLVDVRYRQVGEVCGHEVYLRKDTVRRLAPPPLC